MKTIILSLLLFISVNAQSELLTLFADDGVTYSTEAQQYFDRLPTAIPDDTLAFIAAFIDSMQGRGYWTRVDEAWLLANKTSANALIGMKGLSNATIGGTITFTPYRGFTSNGTTGYINTNFNPATDGAQFNQDDCGFGFYSRTDQQSEGHDFGGRDATNFTRIKSRSTANVVDTWVNQSVTNTSRANTSSTGFIYANRTAATVYGTYRNGVVIVSVNTGSSTGLLNVDMSLGGQNNQGVVANFTTREYSFAMVGDAFTATEQVLIYGFLEVLLDHLGAGVIP